MSAHHEVLMTQRVGESRWLARRDATTLRPAVLQPRRRLVPPHAHGAAADPLAPLRAHLVAGDPPLGALEVARGGDDPPVRRPPVDLDVHREPGQARGDEYVADQEG